MDARTFSKMEEKLLDLVPYIQWQKIAVYTTLPILNGFKLSCHIMKVLKLIGLPLCMPSKKQFSSKKAAYYAQFKAQFLTENKGENVRHYTLKDQHLFEKRWFSEPAATINLNCNENFTEG